MRHLCAVIATTLLTGSVLADTINVPGDHATIQGAIDASSNGDVIEIAAGTYFEYDINPGGRAITISGATNADGTPAVTIDAQANGRVLICNSGETNETTIQNLEITGGYVCNDRSVYGLGMRISGSSPTVSNCIFRNNEVKKCDKFEYVEVFGGALHVGGGSAVISSCTFTQNTARYGGAVYAQSGTFINCTFMENMAWDGGGIYLGNATFTGCTITNNTASDRGGGMYCYNNSSTTGTIYDSIIENNSAGGGGGIFCDGSMSLSGTTIANNTAGWGGGIFCDGSILLNDTIITKNSAIRGGGMQVMAWGATSGGIFSMNSAEYGGGIHGGDTFGCSEYGSGTITNAVVQNNIALFNGGGVYSYCIDEEATVVVGSIICGNEPNQEWQINADEDTLAQIQEECTSDIGVCCVCTGCSILTEEQCSELGGQYLPGMPCDECPTPCLGDVTGDGQVNVADLLTVIANWNNCP